MPSPSPLSDAPWLEHDELSPHAQKLKLWFDAIVPDDAADRSPDRVMEALRAYVNQKTGARLAQGSLLALMYEARKRFKRRSDQQWRAFLRALRSKEEEERLKRFAVNPERHAQYLAHLNRFVEALLIASPGSPSKMACAGAAVVLTMATGLRSSEVQQLHVSHLSYIAHGRCVRLKVKKRQARDVRLHANAPLLAAYEPHLRRYASGRNKILKYGASCINRTLGGGGLLLVRRIVTSDILAFGGDVRVAQTFNRHADARVTVGHYFTSAPLGALMESIVGDVH